MAVADFEFPISVENWAEPLVKYSKWLVIALIVVPLLEYSTRKRVKKNPNVPIIALSPGTKLQDTRERFRQDAQAMLLDGYKKHKGKPFYIPSPLGERLMIPPKYVEELKTAPVEEVDFVGTFFEMMEGRYTTMGSRSSLHPRVARLQLNQYMENILQPVNDEIIAAFGDEVPLTDNWTEVRMSDKILWIVARASSRMFGGLSLSRNTEWLNASLNFATDGFIGAQKIKAFPKLLRPICALLLPEVRRIHKHYDTTRKAVRPILDARKNGNEKASDFLQWMVEDANGEEQNDNFLADILLKISFAALHTSAATPMQLLYDLCEHPEYISPLREELEQVWSEYGVWTKQSLGKLRKLDSFMKESARFNPLLLITFERIVHQDYTLSDGFHIPAGTHIGAPSQAISMNPSLYSDPETFDGWRHEKIRQAVESDPAAAGRAKWASANLENMAFGYGRHACPGRFFADYEIKLIIAHLLLTWDFEYVPGQQERPKNFMAETQMIPSHETKVRMRKRRLS